MKKLFILIVLCLPLFSSLLRPGFYNMQDNMQPFRLYEMNRCFQDTQLPCRWVPDMGFGYGYPLYLFYAPGPYYLGSLLHVFGFLFVDTVKILLVAGFLISAIGMFLLLTETFNANPLGAFVGSILYLYAPVRAVQVYVRGSLSEFLAFAVFPFLFYFSLRLIKYRRWRDAGFFSFSLALMFLTHNLMSYAVLPLLLIWTGFHLFSARALSALPKLLVSLTLGFSLAAFFLLPLVFENNLVHLETLVGGYFGYRQHFVSLTQLFLTNDWGYGSSNVGSIHDLSLSVGPVHWLLSLFALVLALLNFRRRKPLSVLVLLLCFCELGLLFLMHRRSTFIWEAFPFLSYFQFPWRFLVLSNFVTSILTAAVFAFLAGWNGLRPLGVVVVAALLLLHGSFFQPQKWLNYSDSDMFQPAEFARSQTISIFDYLPKVASQPPQTPAPATPEFLSGQGTINSYTKGSDFQSGQISVSTPQAVVRLPLFDYYGMQVSVDGRLISHSHSDCRFQPFCYGLINFTLPAGLHTVSVRFTATPDRQLGDLISLISLSLVMYMLFRRSAKPTI